MATLGGKLFIDLALLSFFSVGHSWLITKKGRILANQIMPASLFYLVYGLHSCISLILLFTFWQKLPGELYVLEGIPKILVEVLMVVSWIFMAKAQYDTGALSHIGLEQPWRYIRGEKLTKTIPYQGTYSVCRHPIFFAFFGMIWFTPNMTSGHLLVSMYWSVYLVLGTLFKESHMMRNKKYRSYMEQVPAYPFLPKKPFIELIPFPILRRVL
jgi:steroid 5-alpha reductase family enzyme